MGWLKKIGQILLASSTAAKVAVPFITAKLPNSKLATILGKTDDFLTKATNVVVSAEVMGQAMSASGPDKLKGAAPGIAQLVLASDIMIGRHIAADKAPQADVALRGITSHLADFLNCLEDDESAPVVPQ